MKHILFTMLLGTVLSGCYDCGPQQELSINLTINSLPDTIPALRKIYSINGIDTIDLSDKIEPFDPGHSRLLTLPLTLHENQTTYFFDFEDRKDTLTVFYERNFYYDNHCGFVTDVSTSKNPPRAIGSFSNVQIHSTPYVGGEHANNFLESYIGGISIIVSL